MENTIHYTTTPDALVVRLPAHGISIDISRESTVFIDGELGRVRQTERTFPSHLGRDPEQIAHELACQILHALGTIKLSTRKDHQL